MVNNEHEKLVREKNRLLDEGLSLIDVCIIFENRLWQMNEDKVDKKSNEYLALEEYVISFRCVFARRLYRELGWHQKHSGEWVRKSENERKKDD